MVKKALVNVIKIKSMNFHMDAFLHNSRTKKVSYLKIVTVNRVSAEFEK